MRLGGRLVRGRLGEGGQGVIRRSPLGSGSFPVVIKRVLHHEPDLSGLPEKLRGIATECLAKNPPPTV
ncbi:hypothetical protein [Nonomuraea sp. NPDC003754]